MPRKGKAAELAAWLEANRPAQIGEEEFASLRDALAPISDSYLRTLVRACGAPLAPLVEGVRQATFDELEATLRNLLDEYQRATPARRAAIRRLVITAKDHARLAAGSHKTAPSKRAEKEEMILWLTTWLENPPVFPDWVRLRRGIGR